MSGRVKITNEMKAQCIGEFEFSITAECGECIDVGADEDCKVCQGGIAYERKIAVPWDTCKQIYKRMAKYAPDQAARESEGGEAVGLRHALQRVDPLSFNNFDDLLGEMQRNGITCAQKPDKWIPCSERLPTRVDEDPFGEIYCLVDGVPCRVSSHQVVLLFDAGTDILWKPTGLTRPAPPEQESE